MSDIFVNASKIINVCDYIYMYMCIFLMSLISMQIVNNKLLLFEIQYSLYEYIYYQFYTMYMYTFSFLKIVQLYLQHIALSP